MGVERRVLQRADVGGGASEALRVPAGQDDLGAFGAGGPGCLEPDAGAAADEDDGLPEQGRLPQAGRAVGEGGHDGLTPVRVSCPQPNSSPSNRRHMVRAGAVTLSPPRPLRPRGNTLDRYLVPDAEYYEAGHSKEALTIHRHDRHRAHVLSWSPAAPPRRAPGRGPGARRRPRCAAQRPLAGRPPALGMAGRGPDRARRDLRPPRHQHRRGTGTQPAPHPAISTHAELGDQLLVFVAPLLIVVLGLVLVERRRHAPERADGPGTVVAPRLSGGRARVAIVVLAVLTVALAGASAVQVFRIGDSGARAVWGDVTFTPQPRHTGAPQD